MDKDKTPDKQVFSEGNILLATFFGGPLAAGYMMADNFKKTGEYDEANKTMAISIVFSIIMYGLLFVLPDSTIEKIPSFLIPFICTIIIALIFQKYQKQKILKLKEEGAKYFSWWRSTGIGILFMIVQLAVVALFVTLKMPDFQAKIYDEGIEKIMQNEKEALKVYEIMESGTQDDILYHLREKGIALWQENLDILDRLDRINGLPDELREQDRLLRRYCNLRIVSYRIMEKMIREKDDRFVNKLDSLQNEINTVIEDLSK